MRAGAVLSLAAYNTVTRGMEETVTTTASPASARIRTSLGHECPRSPCIVKISRKSEFTASAEARGYRTGSLLVRSVLTDQATPGVLGNVSIPAGSVGLVQPHMPSGTFYQVLRNMACSEPRATKSAAKIGLSAFLSLWPFSLWAEL